MARTLLQILSFYLLIYLCATAFMGLDFAASMQKAWIITEKERIDAADNIETAKSIAKDKLDIIERSHQKQSKKSYRFFVLLLMVIVIQGYLLAAKLKQTVTAKKRVD